MDYKIGTRGSALALAQTNLVIDKLKKAYPDDTFEAVVIKTTGDRHAEVSLDAIGSKGVFVDAIEEALLRGDIRMAVHSMKDMPDTCAEGLMFSRPWKREDPRDVLILREAKSLFELPLNAAIATGSKRRAFSLLALRPDLTIVPIRGNIDTRIKKLHEQKLDGIVLAAAGLKRLHRECEITQYFSVEEMIPAPAQGVLAIELRADDGELLAKLDALSDETTAREVMAERGFLKGIGGDCHLPIGAHAMCGADGTLALLALFGNEDGSSIRTAKVTGDDPMALAEEAVRLVGRGNLHGGNREF